MSCISVAYRTEYWLCTCMYMYMYLYMYVHMRICTHTCTIYVPVHCPVYYNKCLTIEYCILIHIHTCTCTCTHTMYIAQCIKVSHYRVCAGAEDHQT